jgi:DNA-directed RNA polymerase subunit F
MRENQTDLSHNASTSDDRANIIRRLLTDQNQNIRQITRDLLVQSEDDRRIAIRIASIKPEEITKIKAVKKKLQSYCSNNRIHKDTIKSSEHAIEVIAAFQRFYGVNEMKASNNEKIDDNWKNAAKEAIVYYNELKEKYNGKSNDYNYTQAVKNAIDDAELLDQNDKEKTNS